MIINLICVDNKFNKQTPTNREKSTTKTMIIIPNAKGEYINVAPFFPNLINGNKKLQEQQLLPNPKSIINHEEKLIIEKCPDIIITTELKDTINKLQDNYLKYGLYIDSINYNSIYNKNIPVIKNKLIIIQCKNKDEYVDVVFNFNTVTLKLEFVEFVKILNKNLKKINDIFIFKLKEKKTNNSIADKYISFPDFLYYIKTLLENKLKEQEKIMELLTKTENILKNKFGDPKLVQGPFNKILEYANIEYKNESEKINQELDKHAKHTKHLGDICGWCGL